MGSYLNHHFPHSIHDILTSYSNLVQEIYDCGARHFLIFNIPPTTRTPQLLGKNSHRRRKHARFTNMYNGQLVQQVKQWTNLLDSVRIAKIGLRSCANSRDARQRSISTIPSASWRTFSIIMTTMDSQMLPALVKNALGGMIFILLHVSIACSPMMLAP